MDFAFKNKNTFLYWGIVNFPPSLVKNAESTEFLKHNHSFSRKFNTDSENNIDCHWSKIKT